MKFMMKQTLFALLLGLAGQQGFALSMAPDEFSASRQLACVLAEQSLGYLSDDEYGARTHTVLDGFDDAERDNILAKALGYVDGLMFAIEDSEQDRVNARLDSFVTSESCEAASAYRVTVSL